MSFFFKIVGVLLGCLFMYYSSTAQNYRIGVGAKVGKTSGLTFKAFVADFRALETVIGYGDKGYRFSQVFEFHKHAHNLKGHSGWHFYIGFGGHFSYYPSQKVVYLNGEKNETYVGYGPMLVGGFEYAFKGPFSFGMDFRPMIEVTTIENVKPRFWDGGVFLRHNFY